MKIGIDIDDTIADSYDSFLKCAFEYDKTLRNTGIVSKKRLYHYDFDWTEEEISNFYKVYFGRSFGGVTPKEDAMEILKKLKDEGHRIVYITSRNNMDTKFSAYDITMEWMRKYNVPYDEVITECNDKEAVCLREKVDVFIDDSQSQCTNTARNKDIMVILYDEFNMHVDYDKSPRVNTWNEIYNIIKSME